MTRPARFAGLAVLAACVVLVPARAAGTANSVHGWMQNAWTVHVLDGTDPAVAGWAFSQPSSFTRGAARDGFTATQVWPETSYAQFQADLAAGAIPAGYTWVLYDPEKWSQTPLAEQQSPVYYMTLFGQLAHASGYRVALAPARDLGNVTGSTECPKQAGENLDGWFVRCDIAQAAAQADLFQVQSQVDTTDLAAFGALVTQVAAQARAANPWVLVFDGLSGNYGTPGQAVTAAEPVAGIVDGTYVTCANSDTGWEDQVLTQLQAAGY